MVKVCGKLEMLKLFIFQKISFQLITEIMMAKPHKITFWLLELIIFIIILLTIHYIIKNAKVISKIINISNQTIKMLRSTIKLWKENVMDLEIIVLSIS